MFKFPESLITHIKSWKSSDDAKAKNIEKYTELIRESLEELLDGHHPLYQIGKQTDRASIDRIECAWFESSLGRPEKSARLMAGFFCWSRCHLCQMMTCWTVGLKIPTGNIFCGEMFSNMRFRSNLDDKVA